jgi:hypothetical protein
VVADTISHEVTTENGINHQKSLQSPAIRKIRHNNDIPTHHLIPFAGKRRFAFRSDTCERDHRGNRNTDCKKQSAQQIRLAALAEDYYQKSLELNPISATEQGEHRYDDRLPMTLTPEVRAQELAFYKKLHADLSRIQRQQLNVQEKQTLDIMLFETEAALKLSAFPDHLMPVNQMDSIPLTLAHFAGGQSAQPLKTPEQYRTFLKRLNNCRHGYRQRKPICRKVSNAKSCYRKRWSFQCCHSTNTW